MLSAANRFRLAITGDNPMQSSQPSTTVGPLQPKLFILGFDLDSERQQHCLDGTIHKNLVLPFEPQEYLGQLGVVHICEGGVRHSPSRWPRHHRISCLSGRRGSTLCLCACRISKDAINASALCSDKVSEDIGRCVYFSQLRSPWPRPRRRPESRSLNGDRENGRRVLVSSPQDRRQVTDVKSIIR